MPDRFSFPILESTGHIDLGAVLPFRYNVHMSSGPATESLPGRLQEIPRWLEGTEGFHALLESLKAGFAATVDGAWNSSASLIAAALGAHAPATLLIVLPIRAISMPDRDSPASAASAL